MAENIDSGEKRFANLDYAGGVVILDWYPAKDEPTLSESDPRVVREKKKMSEIASALGGTFWYSGVLRDDPRVPTRVSSMVDFGIPDGSSRYVDDDDMFGIANDIFLPRIEAELRRYKYGLFGEVLPGALRKDLTSIGQSSRKVPLTQFMAETKTAPGEKRFANLDYVGGVVKLDYYPLEGETMLSESDPRVSREKEKMAEIARVLEGTLLYSGIVRGDPVRVSSRVDFGIPDNSSKYVRYIRHPIGPWSSDIEIVNVFLPRIRTELKRYNYELFGEVLPGAFRRELASIVQNKEKVTFTR